MSEITSLDELIKYHNNIHELNHITKIYLPDVKLNRRELLLICKCKKLRILILSRLNYSIMPEEIVNCNLLYDIRFHLGLGIYENIICYEKKYHVFLLEEKMMIFCKGRKDYVIDIKIPHHVTHLIINSYNEFYNYNNLPNHIEHLQINDNFTDFYFLGNLPPSLKTLFIIRYVNMIPLSTHTSIMDAVKLPFGCELLII